MSTTCLKRPTRPPPMPPTLDVDQDSNSSKQHHNGHQPAHFDTPSPRNSNHNESRYNFQHNTLHNHRHQHHHQYNLNDRHHQTMVTILPSQHGYDRSSTSSSQTSDPRHLGHQHSHSFSHTNSFTLGKHHQHPSSRFHEKNDFYLQHKQQQQLHNFSTSTSRRSHHSQYNSKSRINDYIKISDCQSSAPQPSNYLEASYMLPSPLSNHNVSRSNDRLQSKSTEYKQVDFIKTDALQDLKVEKADRERGKST